VIQEEFKYESFERELLDPLGGRELSDLERFIAGLLLTASSDRPLKIAEIILAVERTENLRLKGKSPKSKERSVKDVIRSLRKEHALPILSRRESPAGFWWCGSSAEMSEFIETFKAQPLDELHTLSQIVKHNYPALMGQLSFEGAS
jgi:hypothetical protein